MLIKSNSGMSGSLAEFEILVVCNDKLSVQT